MRAAARRALAEAIMTAIGVIALAGIGYSVRGSNARGGVARDLAAGAIVVGIAAAIAWAESELEGPPDGDD